MKPLKLTMQAFGPYADKEVIDFEKLENRKMFVISGKTGSGKTSVLDGISFALYGKASGEDREGADLRSHFASDELPTEVSLVFSLRNQTYYIWRSPQQPKKKARGDGYTVVNARAELYIYTSGGKKLLAANVRDTDEKIKEIMQLDANQFRQIIMIPQGDFRKLLTSNSKEKEIILQRLFHTEVYKKVEETLKEKANSLKNEITSRIELRNQTIRGVFAYGDEKLEEALFEQEPNDAVILPLLENATLKMKEDVLRLSRQINVKQKERDEAKRKLHEAEHLLKEMEAFETLKKKKEELEGRKTEMEAKKSEIKRAYKARHLQHQESVCRRLSRELKEHEEKLRMLEAGISACEKEKTAAEKRLKQEEENKEIRERLQSELIRLESIREEVYSYAEKKNALFLLDGELKDTREKIGQTKKRNGLLEKEIASLQKKVHGLGRIQTETAQLELEHVRMKNTHEKLLQLAEAAGQKKKWKKRRDSTSAQWHELTKKAEDARAALEYVESQWKSGQAAFLAKQLVDGCPCPVCGAINHPAPAKAPEGLVDEKDIQAAKSDLQALETERQRLERHMIELETSIDLSEQAYANLLNDVSKVLPGFDHDDMDKELRLAEQRIRELTDAIAQNRKIIRQLPEMEKKLQGKEEERINLHHELDRLLETERMQSNEFAELSALVKNMAKNIPEELAAEEMYENKVASIKKKAENMEQALNKAMEDVDELSRKSAGLHGARNNLLEAVGNIQEKLSIERDAFLNQLRQEGFSGYQDYQHAKREPQTIERLEQEVQLYGEDYRSVTDRLHDYQDRLENVEKPDVRQLEEAFRVLEKDLESLKERESDLSIQIKKNLEIKTAVLDMNARIKSLEQEYGVVGHLADVAKGNNAFRLTFERYVLASFLDEILISANSRLHKMTSGRYKLSRKKDRSKGNAQSGLELLVFDQYTGQKRHVKTLSGGESFKAALALALGMADIVQQQAGGVSLETMFIDEGFGTLDPESLDQAIEALMDIQSSGRLVGIISHVPELKERMDARLEVIAGQGGSRTEFVFS
jgi:exonuclease SbcC